MRGLLTTYAKMQKANQRELTGFSNQQIKGLSMADKDFALTRELLNEVFFYDGERLFWKMPTRGHSVGQVAGSTYSGYCCIKYKNKLYKAHRLIYLMVHGELPEFIDHIDGNPLNNRIDNLRPATKAENGFNRKINSNNTSGHKGVGWDKQAKKWKARCWENKKMHTIGFFDTIEQAADAIKSARIKLHGDYARHQ